MMMMINTDDMSEYRRRKKQRDDDQESNDVLYTYIALQYVEFIACIIFGLSGGY
jgi:hypothetical protein